MTIDSARTVGDAGERALIERIRRAAGSPPAWIPRGIGDDAAVVLPARSAVDVISTDVLVEDVHFRRAWTSARAIGRKALAVALSDLAATAAAPRAAFLSLVLPADLPIGDFDDLVDAVAAFGRETGAVLAGGNLARSPGPLVVDVTVLGAAPRRKLLSRSGGRPGDELWLTGAIGGAAAGLAALSARGPGADFTMEERQAIERYERPEPRLACGLAVGRSRSASAAIDLSDGLADAVRLLAEASGTGAEVEADRLPIDPAAAACAAAAGQDACALTLEGGEDYELLFAVRPRLRSRFLSVIRSCRGLQATCVGRLIPGGKAWLLRDAERRPLAGGFSHFRHAGPETGREQQE